MAEINEVLEVAIKQLDKKKDELKEELKKERDLNQALAVLDEKATTLKEQLKVLSQLPVPKDLLDFYVKSGGRVWVSKLRGFEQGDRFEIHHRARIINYSVNGTTTLNGLPSGAYRFVLLMIPQDIPKAVEDRWGHSHWLDEYGEPFSLGADC